MASFALVSVEKDYKVDISEGKVTVGRGPYLKITDKRVSRNHATLEVSDASLTILPIHTNPTFYQACGETKFEPLEKDEVKELQNGDCIAFLPNDLIFRVERKDSGTITEDVTAEEGLGEDAAEASDMKDIDVETNNKASDNEDVNIENKDKEDKNVEIKKGSEEVGWNPAGEVSAREGSPEISDDEAEQSDEHFDEVDWDKTEMEETARPLNKTRVLPSWMTKNKGKEVQENSKKGKTTKKIAKKVDASKEKTNEDLVESEDIMQENDNKTSEKEQNNEQEDVSVEKEEQESRTSQVIEEEDKKRKRDENEDVEQSSKKEKKLPCCPYGAGCYRKNPVHFQEYSHDQEASDDSENEDESRDDLPECPYGEYCYRKNPRHRREYKHTPQPKTRERKAKKKAGTGKIRDDDEDGPNDYDFEDSFIDDESESDHEPSDGSDWQPSRGGEDDDDDDGDGEDVGELLTEARNFTHNKKMMKPT